MIDTFEKWFNNLRRLEQERLLKHIEANYLNRKDSKKEDATKHLKNYCPTCKRNY